MNTPNTQSYSRQGRSKTALRMSAVRLQRFSATVISMALAGLALAAKAVDVKVDSTQNWIGYMNYLNPDAGWKPGGQAWALADLRAGFSKTNAAAFPLNDWAWVVPNTNTYNPADPFWNNPDGSAGQTILEQNFYVDVFTNFGGQTVTFSGVVGTNTLAVPTDPTHPTNGYLAYAVVKEFTAPNYGWVGLTQVPLLAGQPFTVSRAIPAGGICQYGILVIGPNAGSGPAAANPNTGISVKVEDSDPAITLQPVGGLFTVGDPITLTSGGAGATALSYQWQKNGTNVVNGGTISGATTTNLTISSSVAADSGAYTFIVTDSAGSITSAVATVTVLNVIISDQPDDQRIPVGASAVLSATVTSPNPLSFRWAFVTNGVTNFIGAPFPYKPANVSGFATNVLTVSNAQLTNSGSYILRITDGVNFFWTDFAELLVKTPADWVNFLENPGFESDPAGLNESPWFRFESTDPTFGEFQSAADTYYGGDPVNVQAGTYVSFTTFNAIWSGIYQDVIAQPGDIFTADMYFYNAGGAGGDPIPGPDILATNESYLEVQFRNAGDQVIHQYITEYNGGLINHTFPANTWIQLQATNAGGYSQTGTPAPADANYLVAPPGTTHVRFQVTLHDIAGSVGLGSLYYDSARLLLKRPATLSAVQAGANIDISWETLAATSYQVQWKDNAGGSWTNLEVVPGTGGIVTRSYSSAGGGRLYRVLTL